MLTGIGMCPKNQLELNQIEEPLGGSGDRALINKKKKTT